MGIVHQPIKLNTCCSYGLNASLSASCDDVPIVEVSLKKNKILILDFC